MESRENGNFSHVSSQLESLQCDYQLNTNTAMVLKLKWQAKGLPKMPVKRLCSLLADGELDEYY